MAQLRPMGRATAVPFLLPLLLLSLFTLKPATSSAPATISTARGAQNGAQLEAASQQLVEQFLLQNFPQTSKASALSQEGAQFDATQYKSVYEAIRAHPDLREVSVDFQSDY